MMKVKGNVGIAILYYLLAIFMIYAGVQHFVKPDFYQPFVPGFLPNKELFIFLSGVVEAGLGLMLFFNKRIATLGALGIFILMLIFLPIHVRDVIVENPAIGSTKLAWIRLPFQFLFILWAWVVYKKTKNSKA